MKTIASIALLFVLMVNSRITLAQAVTADSVYYITTKNGETISGTLKEKNEKQISITTHNFGVVNVLRDSIKQLQVLPPTSYKNGKFFFPNPNATRYFVSPSSIPLKKGEGYFQNTYLFLCTVNYGVSDHISVGGGIDVLTPFIQDAGGPIALANLKAGFQATKNFYIAGTTLLMHSPNMGNNTAEVKSNTYLLEDATFTVGNPDVNLTAGVSYGLKNGEWMHGPVLTISGMARVTPRFSFVSENWIYASPQYIQTWNISDNTYTDSLTSVPYKALVSYGMRFMSQKIAVDFGFINNGDIVKEIFIGIPYVDFVVKF